MWTVEGHLQLTSIESTPTSQCNKQASVCEECEAYAGNSLSSLLACSALSKDSQTASHKH